MNDPAFQKVINTWLSDEVYRRLGGVQAKPVEYKAPRGPKAKSKKKKLIMSGGDGKGPATGAQIDGDHAGWLRRFRRHKSSFRLFFT
jgi:hypothetical protein